MESEAGRSLKRSLSGGSLSSASSSQSRTVVRKQGAGKGPSPSGRKKIRRGGAAGDSSKIVVDIDEDEGILESDEAYRGVSPQGASMHHWRSQHCIARQVLLNPSYLAEPDPAWSARIRKPSHVQKLMDSFMKTASVNNNVQAVIIDTELFELYRREPKHSKFRDMVALAADYQLMTFAGDHSRQACAELHERYPNTVVWSAVPTDIYLCAEEDADIRMLRMLGNVDNMAAGLQLASDFAIIVQQLRRHYMAIMKSGGVLNKKRLLEIKEDYAFSLAIPLPSVNQYFQIAQLGPKAWPYCEKILQGQCKPFRNAVGRKNKNKAPKPIPIPKSAHAFTLLGNIPDEVVAKLLRRVVEGEIDVVGLRKACTKVKGQLRLKTETIQFLTDRGNLQPDQDGAYTWKCVSAQFPQIGCRKWLDIWLPTVEKCAQREPLPSQLYDEIQRSANQAQFEQVHFARMPFIAHITQGYNTHAHHNQQAAIAKMGDCINLKVTGKSVELFNLDAKVLAKKVERRPYGTTFIHANPLYHLNEHCNIM